MTKSKTADESVRAFRLCSMAYYKHTKHKIYRLETDRGSEWEGSFRKYLKTKHIHLKAKKQPQRMIESLNKTLRAHVERVDYGRKGELRQIIAKFNQQYNNSSHGNLDGACPLDILSLNEAEIKIEARRPIGQGPKRIQFRRAGRPVKTGSLVRVFLDGEKDEFGHKGTKPMWTKTIFMVIKK